MSRLNEQYFETKKQYKKSYQQRALTFKSIVKNFIIFFVFLIIFSILNKNCSLKIEENRIKDERIFE
jgi:hypothetical protein